MGVVTFEGIIRDLHMNLVDGYLPERDLLIRLAEQSAESPLLKDKDIAQPPYSWDDWEDDGIYSKLAYNIKRVFCASKPVERKGGWSEAWLLEPKRWIPEFDLKQQKKDNSNRRLFVTLYDGCEFGEKCLTNLVQKTHFKIIPEQEYANYEAFIHKGEELLESISMPFMAPCIIAGERIQAQGYMYMSFGR